MKILIIGNSANGYALAKKLSLQHEIYITPSSDTLNEFATCLDIREDSVTELLEFVLENGIDMTIPVSKISIKANIADIFSNNKQPIFAPTSNAAEIIYNKSLAKKTLYKLRIPTPKFGIFEKESVALDYINNQSLPFVIKTDANNSATIITSLNTAKNIISSVFTEKNNKLIIEDYVYGSPFAFYTITDGYKALPIGSSLIYRHSLEGNGGQLTSGMGACSPNYKLSIDQEYYLMDNVIYPTLEHLERNNCNYTGILGINGILSENGKISVLGWQFFMQNSDAAAIIELIEEDLYSLFDKCIIGSFSDEIEIINNKNKSAVSVVLSNRNKNSTNNVIYGIENLDEDTIVTYYPNITKNKYFELEANNGNNLIITSTALTTSTACLKAYAEVNEIDYNGKNYRKDICS